MFYNTGFFSSLDSLMDYVSILLAMVRFPLVWVQMNQSIGVQWGIGSEARQYYRAVFVLGGEPLLVCLSEMQCHCPIQDIGRNGFWAVSGAECLVMKQM